MKKEIPADAPLYRAYADLRRDFFPARSFNLRVRKEKNNRDRRKTRRSAYAERPRGQVFSAFLKFGIDFSEKI
jgi:hypothetical protein